jgi:hypothetical protein
VTNSILSNNAASSTGSAPNAPGGGGYGGGIFNEGTLTVINSTISGNTASGLGEGVGGGIYNEDGKVTVDTSTISNNSASSSGSDGVATGGGITNDNGTLIVTASTFASNLTSGVQGAIGGGIYNGGKLIVTQSTFLHNSSNSSNSYKSGGGGIANFGTLTAINSTFADNSVEGKQGSYGGGIYYNGVKGSSDIIRFCTLFKNSSRAGGGIFFDAKGNRQITLSSNIIAANSASTGPDIAGVLISGGYNLIENAAGATGLNASTDRQVALADLKIDSALSNHGGPTQTLALLQGSQAIDAVPLQACSITVIGPSGQNVTITTDQRGDARPDGSENTCDIGAYESAY